MKPIYCKTGSDRLINIKLMMRAHGNKRHWLCQRLNECVEVGESCRAANESETCKDK